MGALLKKLTQQAPTEPAYDMADDKRKMGIEVSVAVDGDAFEKGIMDVGPLTPFTCPECQGVLVKLNEGKLKRFRCHTGHAYSTSALLSGVMEKIDESYWAAMRSLEEAAMLLEQTGKDFAKEGEHKAAAVFLEHARVTTEQSRLLRNTVLSSERFSGDSLLNKAGEK